MTIQSAERGGANQAGTLGRMLQLHPDRVNPASLWALSTHREEITCRLTVSASRQASARGARKLLSPDPAVSQLPHARGAKRFD